MFNSFQIVKSKLKPVLNYMIDFRISVYIIFNISNNTYTSTFGKYPLPT